MNANAGAAASEASQMRIITLSPHLTELVYALGKGNNVVAVSDYSDYPERANLHPKVASYEGANIAEIIRLQPTHIIAWRGGNKDADIQKLSLLGYTIFESSINSPQQLVSEIKALGKFIDARAAATALAKKLSRNINSLQGKYNERNLTAIYYLNLHPLTGLGKDKWLNELLNLCGIKNIYETSLSAYPQLHLADVLRQQPQLIIAANGATKEQADSFWQVHEHVLSAKLVVTNPDALHRFTPRAIDGVIQLCQQAYKS